MQRVYNIKTFGGVPLPLPGSLQSQQLAFYQNGTWAAFSAYSSGPSQQTGTYTFDPTTGAMTMIKDSDGKVYATGFADEDVIVGSHDGTLALQAVGVATTNWKPAIIAGGVGLALALVFSSND